MTEKLKPCPFCGCEQIEILPQKQKNSYLISCARCTASRFAITRFQDQLVAEWNTRPRCDQCKWWHSAIMYHGSKCTALGTVTEKDFYCIKFEPKEK